MSKVKSYRTKYSRAKPKQSKKPLILIIGGAVLLLAAVLFAFAQQQQPTVDTVGGTPKIKADKERVDLGDQALGSTAHVAFTLTNEGSGTLRFTKDPYVEVKEGCWPPIPAIGSMAIRPGESTTVSLEFMMHEGMDGKHDFRVHLPSNDPGQPDLVLTVLSNWK